MRLLLAIGFVLVATTVNAEISLAVAFDKTLDSVVVITQTSTAKICDIEGKEPHISYGIKGGLICLVKRTIPQELSESSRVEVVLYNTRSSSVLSTKVEAEYMGLGPLFSNVTIDDENSKVYFVVVCDESHVAKIQGNIGTHLIAWDYVNNNLDYYRIPRVKTMHDMGVPHIYTAHGRVFLGDDDSLYSCNLGESQLTLESVYEADQIDPRQAVGPKDLTQPPRFSLDRTPPVAFHYLPGRGVYWTDNHHIIINVMDISLAALSEPIACLRYSDRFITDLAVTNINGESYFIYGESLEPGYQINTVVVLDPGTGEELKRIPLAFAGYTLSPVNSSNDGSFVIQNVETETAMYFDAATGTFAALGPLGVHARTKLLVQR